MTIRIAVRHKTVYRFDRPVSLSPHIVRLRPAPHTKTPIVSFSLNVSPQEHFINWQQDPFGNFLARLVFPKKTRELEIDVELVADMVAHNPFDFFVEPQAEHFPFKYDKQLCKDLQPYLEKCELTPLFKDWLASISTEKKPVNDFIVDLNQKLEKRIAYSLRFEPGVQTPEETLQLERGSCRDTGWLLVQTLRHLGLAARFVSGYLVQLAPDIKSLDGPSGPELDFTDLHAWCEVFIPGAGWVGLDPTSGLLAGEGHIPLACTPDPVSAAPITGATDKCEVEFSYTNNVYRVKEDPRVTKPYSDEEWEKIDALGKSVDQRIEQNDLRLTMGGEPTFISIDDMESAQWNTEALGAHKLALAKTLLLRLRDRFAPNGLLHYGQGKWYPGEEIPRWALGCFWRSDGVPLWRNPKLLARVDKDYGYTQEHAERFVQRLTTRLGITSTLALPAYEDSLYYLWREERMPTDVSLQQAAASKNLEQRRIAARFQHGLDKPVGFILPLYRDTIHNKWQGSDWEIKSDRIELIPGDSPIGLRLPLSSLPASSQKQTVIERDPFETREPLNRDDSSPATQRTASRADHSNTSPSTPTGNDRQSSLPQPGNTLTNIQTTLCIEPRNGRLYIFMPPVEWLEHYIDLLNQIEKVAEELGICVVIEGYEPPRDYRIKKLLVTPDPGVIEVNIQPASNWQELSDITTQLYEEARLSRLTTEKFMLDGRHSGTGGGNHVTLGGATPSDSIFLRRPDMLRSMITFWQHHPSLSYLFSGAFIGPTSQAPRVDEGRDEMLYELEIAFQQMPTGSVDQPWLVDRLLRNLLIDITGNTHRAEFCIDKMFSPIGSSGRQGILEFRGFEMPPHARMALVQFLLIRSLVTRFSERAYHHDFVRWGTLLHDRFMLPHYVWADIKQVVEDLNDNGFSFDLDWLAPFQEFRFPCFGRLQLDDIELELRWAIEPWHVLGEEIGSFGTARYVDSSVERVQVRVSGLTPERYQVVCNGRPLPLRNTGRLGEYVAGVRYRAWHPASALHPTIGVQAPLVFDIVDKWNNKAIGGCTYHVSHAGGRNYETFPVNAIEAESRQIQRFMPIGHTPGLITAPNNTYMKRTFLPNCYEPRHCFALNEESAEEYPHTLDLRKFPSSGITPRG